MADQQGECEWGLSCVGTVTRFFLDCDKMCGECDKMCGETAGHQPLTNQWGR